MLIAICDDNAADRNALVALCRQFFEQSAFHIDIRCYESGEAFLADPSACKAHILLLDIYMQGQDGIQLAYALRENGYGGVIVLVTSSEAHYKDGFSLGAVHYLVKPVFPGAFSEAMRRALALVAEEDRSITVSSNRRLIRIPVKNIIYAEVYGHQTHIHTTAGVISVAISLSELEHMLSDSRFIKCFRSFIVNMAYIECMQDNSFLMHGGASIPLAKRERNAIKDTYMAYIFRDVENT